MVLFYLVWVVCMKSMAGIAEATREQGAARPDFAVRSCYALAGAYTR